MGCETWMVGFDPAKPGEALGEAGADEAFIRSKASARVIEMWQRVGHNSIPWVRPARYQRIALPFDIGLCPLRHDSFTLGKSDCKVLEYLIAGAAPVCSNMPVFSAWEHGETCLKASGSETFLGTRANGSRKKRPKFGFAEAVHLLVRDEKLREGIVERGRAYVREHRGSDQLRTEWGFALNG